MNSHQPSRRYPGTSVEIVTLLTAVILVAGYAIMRYGGLWGDSDTSVFAATINAMVTQAKLIPDQHVYANGYGFPVLATFLVRVTGMSVTQLQIGGGALLIVWLAIPAWLAYRELTGSVRGATLAAVIIFIQPEFLFPIMRGSHEKFTRGLMFLCLFLLVRSILARQNWQHFTAYLLAFYLSVYALITFNNLFATSFITALSLSLLFSLAVQHQDSRQSVDSVATRRRLLYAVAISLILAFFFTFYAYQPARYGFLVAESVWDRLTLLLLEVEVTAQSPYTAFAQSWISVPVYFIISIANWLLLVLSFILWFWQSFSWWRSHAWPTESRKILLWSLYGAFGVLGAFSIVIDYSGALGSNLQHRVFPSFAMIAAAVVTDWFVHWQTLKPTLQRLAYGALVIIIAFLGIVAVLKATNEPSLSNNWQYYSLSEKTALYWSKDVVNGAGLWVGLNERLPAAMGICCADDLAGLTMRAWNLSPGTRDMLVSDIIRSRALRTDFDLSVTGDSFRVYDNGSTQMFHLRPLTPFQR